jgi:hypothetical protein
MEKFEKNHFRETVVIMFLYFFVAFLMIFAVVYVETNLLNDSEKKTLEEPKVDYSKDLFLSMNGVLRFGVDDDLPDIDEILFDKEKKEYVFRLNSGRIWGNFEVSNAKVNILVDKAVVIPDNSSFDLRYMDGRMELITINGDTYVGFLSELIDLLDFADQYSERYLNILLVSRLSQMKLSVSKISSDFARLLPQKLSKTMDLYGAVPGSVREESFVSENLKKDLAFLESLKVKIRNEFRFYLSSKSFISNTLNFLKQSLVFMPEKKLSYEKEEVFDYLNSAISYSINSKTVEMRDALSEFDYLVNEYGLHSDSKFLDILNTYLDLFSIFKSSDNEYPIFEHLLKRGNLGVNEHFKILSVMRRNFFNALSYGEEFAEDNLKKYFDYFEKNQKILRSDLRYPIFLKHQNLILENLFLRTALFYSDEFFLIKKSLEDELIDLSDDEYFKNELLQSFVSSKIDFLTRAWFYLKNDLITVSLAREVYETLFFEINDVLESEGVSELAVLELFERQLKSLADQYAYLNNVQYNSSIFYGVNHEERFASYLRDRQIVPNISSVLKGEEIDKKSVDELSEEIVQFLTNNSFTNIDLENFEDDSVRFVKLKATLSGFDFQAEFDRFQNSFRNIYAYEQLVSESPVRLSNMQSLMQRKFSLITPLPKEEQDEIIETHAQRVAKNFILQKIREQGFTLELDNIVITRNDSSVFRVSDVRVPDNNDVLITFDFVTTDEKVRNLYLNYEGRPVVLDGPYDLIELKTMVLSRVDFEELSEEILQF